jgi:hypothetical protein
MEVKQENEIHLSDLTFVLRVPLKVCILLPSKRQPLSHVTLEESGSRNGLEDDLIEPATKYVPQNPRREISSEKCSVWNSASHIKQWFIEHSGALSMTLRLAVGKEPSLMLRCTLSGWHVRPGQWKRAQTPADQILLHHHLRPLIVKTALRSEVPSSSC